jgi:hypothetical protein
VTWELEESGDLYAWNSVSTGALSLMSPVVIHGDGAMHESTAAFTAAQRRLFRIRFTYNP